MGNICGVYFAVYSIYIETLYIELNMIETSFRNRYSGHPILISSVIIFVTGNFLKIMTLLHQSKYFSFYGGASLVD